MKQNRNGIFRDQAPLIAGFQMVTRWSRTRIGFVVVAILSLTIVLGASALGWFSYNSFCFSQKRFLSEQEYFDAAVDYVLRQDTYQMKSTIEGSTHFTAVRIIQYKDRADFYNSNPACCEIVPHDFGSEVRFVSSTDRLLGRAAKSVRLTYRLNYIDKRGNVQNTIGVAQLAIGNCGSVMNTGL